MKILGLDLGYKTGWAVMEDGEITDHGVFYLDKDNTHGRNFSIIGGFCGGMITKENPDVIVFESPLLSSSYSWFSVGLSSIVMLVCDEEDVMVETVHVSTLKKFATGNGRAKKPDMVRCALPYVEAKEISDDEADAIHLCRWCDAMIRGKIKGKLE